jgi:hypothetical protein
MSLAAELRRPESGDPVLLLATIVHPGLDAPLRVVRNGEDVVSRGETFTRCWFDFRFPAQGEEADFDAEIRIDNLDPEIVKALREDPALPLITLEVVLASAPDAVEMILPEMELREAVYDLAEISGQLSVIDFASEPAVAIRFVPQWFPGL